MVNYCRPYIILFTFLAIVKTTPLGERFFSCKDLKTIHPTYESGLYVILLPSGEHEVYCEMGINGGGYTFIPPYIISKLSSSDIKYLTKGQDDVLLRISRPDGSQPYTVITPYVKESKFSIKISSYDGARWPVNIDLGPYIYLNTLPGGKQVNGQMMAFQSNGAIISYNGTQDYAFGGPKETSNYLIDNPEYEKAGVAVDWRKSAKRPNSCRRMPLDFFMLTELHYCSGGAHTTSERWLSAASPALGTAVGFR